MYNKYRDCFKDGFTATITVRQTPNGGYYAESDGMKTASENWVTPNGAISEIVWRLIDKRNKLTEEDELTVAKTTQAIYKQTDNNPVPF